jgi:hypothetical protein
MKLSDFTAQLEPIVFDPSVMDNNAKRAATQVDWKNTPLTHTEGGRGGLARCFLKDAAAEVNEDPNVKVKVKYKGSESAEPEELEPDDEEEEEEGEDAAFDSMAHFLRLFLKDASLDADIHNMAASLMRERARQRMDGQIISGRKVTHNSGYITDAALIEEYLPANELCVAAGNRLRDRVVREQADNANRSYWSGLFYLLRSQPEGSRIGDIKNKVCLSTLIQKTLAA